ncbi:hypothetical protein D6D00_04970 [Aureobasidium pullulans]|nr:hypothetical protein D6D00_04970 [Aureobasidium pullulans]
MGLRDSISFDSDAYRRKVMSMTPEELREREVKKCRQKVSSQVAMGAGIGLSVVTFGASAVVGGALGGRSWWVAKKKLEIVNAELESRNITLYDTKKRDVIIPVTVGALKVAVTCGLGKAHPAVTVGDYIVKAGKMGAKKAVGSLAYRYSSSETGEYSQTTATFMTPSIVLSPYQFPLLNRFQLTSIWHGFVT